MRTTIEVLNRMREDGVIGQYAITGAVAATFYLDPSATLDLDILIQLQSAPGQSLLILEPIYTYLAERGCRSERESILIGDWPVQFLPISDALDAEALLQAVSTEVEGAPTRVISAEHLVAIALRTGRAKDFARILQFVDSGVLNTEGLDDILRRHGLVEKWERFAMQFLRGRE